MKHRIFLNVCVLVCTTLGFSQATQLQTTSREFNKALSLYNQKLYKSAIHFFQQEKLQNRTPQAQELCSYYIASASIQNKEAFADSKMLAFLEQYPHSSYAEKASQEVADFYFNQGNYKQAAFWLDKIDPSFLPENQQDVYHFKRGYAAFSLKDTSTAQKHLTAVSKASPDASKAAYYLGYMAYDTNDYSQANDYFASVKDETLSSNLSYYQADMNFKQGNFQKALEEAQKQLPKTKNENERSEIHKIIGESYFNLKQYADAIPHLKNYRGKNGQYSNTDFYYLGYAYYKQQEYALAISQFNKIVEGKNAVAQNAYYHLAECYLKMNQKQEALNAFRNAWQMPFNETIKKDALRNYALLSYDIGNPYQSVPSAILAYMEAYPQEDKAQMQALLVDSYITSGNYKEALALLEKSKNESDKKIYQKVAFHRALELYGDGSLEPALGYFQKAQATYDAQIQARATFWAGEMHYQLYQYAEAEQSFQKFLNFPQAKTLSEYTDAHYGLGYAQFNQKKYEAAIASFDAYLNQNPTDKTRIADVQMRKADAYFVLAKYWQAMDAYNQVIATNGADTDYASFQKAISYGFVDRVPKKVEELTAFAKKFPKSNLRQEALFELANTFVGMGEVKKAVPVYEQLKREYPNGNLIPRAMLRESLVYYNQGENAKALSVLKEITQKYPNTSEALQAVTNAKSIYVDMGQVTQYAEWVKSLGYVQLSNSELDNTAFEAAERQHLQGKAEAVASLEKYLKDFPQGLNTTQAHYLLAQIYLSKANKSKAQHHYEAVLTTGNSDYTEATSVALSQLYLDANQPNKAMPLLKNLEINATSVQNKTYAESNLMKILYDQKQYTEAIDYARKVLNNKSAELRAKNDANIITARSYMETKDEAKAQKFYAEVQKNASGQLMAEAMYYDAYFKNKAGEYKKSNEVIQKLAKEYGGYKEFSAKSLLVMAKNFHSLNDPYQATYVLNSVIENFTDYPQVVAEGKEILKSIKESK